MSNRTLALAAIALFGLSAAALAQDPRSEGWSFGAAQYQARCAACHGAKGKGDGTAAKQAKLTVPDITTYAKRNGGKFPVELAWQKIDGRPASFDAERSMPTWGREFRHEALANVSATAKPESYVAAEIFAIIEYMKGLQVK